VTFSGTGQSSGTTWGIVLNGSAAGSAASSIQFSEPNGSYPFTVEPVHGFTVVPSAGTIVVAAANVTKDVAFTSGATALSVSLVVLPNSVFTGSVTWLDASASGGTEPYTYAYTGLPSGCTTANTSALSCTPETSGTYNVTVTVTDGGGSHAAASAKLDVSATSSSSGTNWDWLIIPIAVVALLLLLIVA
jgi:Putative Ig domain